MSIKRNAWFLPVLISLLLAACGAPGDSESDSASPGAAPGESQPAAAGPAVTESDGFRAEAVSYIRVELNWTQVSGAQGYQLEIGFGDDEFFLLANLDSSTNSYEHFLAPEAAEITYRLSALGTDDVRSVTVTTPAAVPSPINVQVTMEVSGFGGTPGAGGFDPATFDPSTFDPSTMDLSAFLPEGFDPENPDPSLLMPQPVEVSQIVGPAGGEISVTGKNGVIYTLTIPGGAVPDDVLITLSPVENIEGIPFSGGFLAGVQIDPRDLEFDVPALLAFEIPEEQEPPADTRDIAFGYENMGEEFRLEPLARNADELTILTGDRTKLASPDEQGWSTRTVYVPVNKTGGRGVTRGQSREILTFVESTPKSTEFIRFNERIAASETQVENASLQLDFYNKLKKMRLQHELGGSINVSDLLLAQDMAEAMENVGEFPYEETLDLLVEMTHRLLKDGKPGCDSREEAEIMVLGGRLVETGGGQSFRSDLRKRFQDHYGEEGRQLLDKVDQALKQCTYVIQITSNMTRDERGLKLGYEVRSETMAWVVIPPGREPFGDLHWVSPRGKGVIRLISHRMNIEYEDFQRNQENQYEICKGKMNTLEGSSLGLTFEVIFLQDAAPEYGFGPGAFQLTDYVIGGQQRGGMMECIDKADGSKSGGSGFSTAGSGDVWATLFFGVHRNPRDILLVPSGLPKGHLFLFENKGPARDTILGLPVTENSTIGILHEPK